jgi:hypothetical protein
VEDPCPWVKKSINSGIAFLPMPGGSHRPYADRLTNYKAVPLVPNVTTDEIRNCVIKQFGIGPNWYDNKVENFRPGPDRTATFTIRDPYKD